MEENAAGGGRCGVEQGWRFNSSLGQFSQPKVKEMSGQPLGGSCERVRLCPWRLRVQISRLGAPGVRSWHRKVEGSI